MTSLVSSVAGRHSHVAVHMIRGFPVGGIMRKTLFLTGALTLVASALPAQAVRWNDRPTATWQNEAPRVRLTIEGPRAVGFGAPISLRFEVSDNAYVTVVRVGDDG